MQRGNPGRRVDKHSHSQSPHSSLKSTFMTKRSKRITYILSAISLLIGTCMYFLFAPVVSEQKGVIYYLRQGISKTMLVAELKQQGIIQHDIIFLLYVYAHPGSPLKTGEYSFPKNSSLVSIWRQVTTGTGFAIHLFTIIPGKSFAQVRQLLDENPLVRHLTTGLTNQQIMERLGHPELAPEGEFFPETYYYTRDGLDLVLLKRAFDLMQKKLTESWKLRAANLPYKTSYEALIAASLVEKEAYLDEEERPVIASVLINRLQKDMLLQFDPTVIYGIGDRYDGKIYKADLKDTNAYNTYVHKGLPPTPIAMPGLASIEAIMHPEKTDYLYFVAKGDGSHQFSKTLIEHNTAVETTRQNQQVTSYFNATLVRRYLNIALASTVHVAV